jgi:hypothetical protein
MSWIKPVGTKVVKYGPHARLIFKHAAGPVTDAAKKTFAAQSNRRTALKHADTVNGGAILKVMDQGAIHWVVFSGGKAVACYPPSDKPFDTLLLHVNLAKKMTPDQYRNRQTAASKRQKAIDTAKTFSSQVRRRRDGF